jgi:hypothetical protein
MTETIQLEIDDPYAEMLDALDADDEADAHADLERAVEQLIHDSYQNL